MPEFKFDPDDVGLTDDPEYQTRLQAPGPATKTSWAPVAASRAKRRQMYLIDAEMSAKWLATMEKLLEADLDDATFTTERMMRLKLWTKERKRRQHNLHYQFDPSRRPRRLVERDSRLTLEKFEKLKTQLDEALVRMAARYPEPTAAELDDGSTVLGRGVRGRAAPRAAAVGTKPEHLTPEAFEMIVADTGIPDPVNASDESILQAYEARGQSGYPAAYFLAMLRDRELPERPDELG